jgi:hypothetical protein
MHGTIRIDSMEGRISNDVMQTLDAAGAMEAMSRSSVNLAREAADRYDTVDALWLLPSLPCPRRRRPTCRLAAPHKILPSVFIHLTHQTSVDNRPTPLPVAGSRQCCVRRNIRNARPALHRSGVQPQLLPAADPVSRGYGLRSPYRRFLPRHGTDINSKCSLDTLRHAETSTMRTLSSTPSSRATRTAAPTLRCAPSMLSLHAVRTAHPPAPCAH